MRKERKRKIKKAKPKTNKVIGKGIRDVYDMSLIEFFWKIGN